MISGAAGAARRCCCCSQLDGSGGGSSAAGGRRWRARRAGGALVTITTTLLLLLLLLLPLAADAQKRPGVNFTTKYRTDAAAGRALLWECMGAGSDPAATQAALTAAGATPAGVPYGSQVSARMTPQVADLVVKRGGVCATLRRSLPSTSALQTFQAAKAMRIRPLLNANPNTINGKGVKVGIISDSYYFLPGSPGSSPCAAVNSATVLRDFFGVYDDQGNLIVPGIDEGRALAELICFLAPKATLLFRTGFNGEADMAAGMVELLNAGADIIVDDVVYQAEPEYMPGLLSQLIDRVALRGVAYFSSAGNSAQSAIEVASASWVVNASLIRPSSLYDRSRPLLNFGTKASPRLFLKVTMLGVRTLLVMQWDEPWGFYTVGNVQGAISDLDFWLCPQPFLDQFCQASQSQNILATKEPLEEILYENTDGFTFVTRYIFVTRFDPGTRPVQNQRIKITTWKDPISVPSGQGPGVPGLTAPRITPHANTRGAMAVGAADYDRTPGYGKTPAVPTFYTARGGTPQVLDDIGVRLNAPVTLRKPDVLAPSNLDTSFFTAGGFGGDNDGTGFPNFQGTSASAGVAAGLAALYLQQRPGLAPQDLYAAMRASASDVPPAGYDRVSGFGFLDGLKLLNPCSGQPDGTACDDFTPCTVNDACSGGRCVGTAKVCSGGNCQIGTCTPATGACAFTNKPNGATCWNSGVTNGVPDPNVPPGGCYGTCATGMCKC